MTTAIAATAAPQEPAQPNHPPAFIDSIGLLREWNTANMLPGDWTGIARTNDMTYLHFSMEAGERAITVLNAKKYEAAVAEARLLEALLVPSQVVLESPEEHSFWHFSANQADPQGLLKVMKSYALTTVHSVTGRDPERFFETAIQRLSKVFGIADGSQEFGNAYFECKALAQAFMLEAEKRIGHLGV